MSRFRVSLIVSLLLLVASNALWAIHFALDKQPETPTSYGCTETEQYAELRDKLVRPLAAAFNSSLKPDATRQSIISAATDESRWPEFLTCVIDSDTSFGQVGTRMRFDGDKLVAVSTEFCTQYRP